uniref:Uncharacterized protein n=1 Tax=viral metagenome TaxID=1070528 RepID=A0A6M3L135_9ZZZZ
MYKYIRTGRFIVGLPARDIQPEELKQLGCSHQELLETGLYYYVEEYNGNSRSQKDTNRKGIKRRVNDSGN